MQSQANRIRRNTVFSFFSQLIRILTNFLLFLGIARLYGVTVFGQFTTAHTLSTICVLIGDFGFDTLLTTHIGRTKENIGSVVSSLFSMKFVFASLATIGMFCVGLIHSFSPGTRILIFIFSFYVLFSVVLNFFFALFKGHEELEHEAIISLIMNCILLALLIVFGIFHIPIYSVAILFVGSRITGILLSYRVVRARMPLADIKFSLRDGKRYLKNISIFGIHFVFGNLYFMLDTILIAVLLGDREVGTYQAVIKIVALVLIMPDIAINTLLPVLSRLHFENREQWVHLSALLNKALFYIILPISLTLGIFADQIITILYGAGSFGTAAIILRIFSIVLFVRFSVETYALVLTTSQRQEIRMAIVVAATIVNLGLNSILIPRNGIVGAAIASLITNCLVGCAYVMSSRIVLQRWFIDGKQFIALAGMTLAAGGLWSIRTVPLWLPVSVMLALYGCIIYFLFFTREDREWIFVRGWK